MGPLTFDELMAVWHEVNLAAEKGELNQVRAMVAAAQVEPDMHVGEHQDTFTPRMIVEWVLGQWAATIDKAYGVLGELQEVSHTEFDQVCEHVGWPG